MTDIRFPEELKDLPVCQAIRAGKINLDSDFILVAHTGSCKTLGIPPVIALRGRKVVLRQPTRQTCKSVYLALQKFWGDQLKIGMHTSEEDHGSLEECNIMVVTDGVLKNWLKEPKYELAVIIDEIHACMPVTEVELGIAKTYKKNGINFQIIALSATIRPSNLVKYFEDLSPHPVPDYEIERLCNILERDGEKINTTTQNQFLKMYYSEGVAYPIENRNEEYCKEAREDPLEDEDDEDEGDSEITEDEEGVEQDTTKPAAKKPKIHPPRSVFKFCERLIEEQKRGLIFLCTRNQIQNLCAMAQKRYPGLASKFAHADVPIEEIIQFVNENKPCAVFATVALATSITLPFDEVYIVDKGIDTVWEEGIEKQLTNIRIDNNGVIQRRGRVGRVKPGVCTLASNYRKDWDDIKPTEIVPPLSKTSPDHVVMVCAQYEVDARGIDILSELPADDIRDSVNRLKRLGLIYEDEEDETLKLTVLGKRVNTLPLEVNIGIMVVKCPDELLPAILAIASFEKGIYNLFQGKITMIDGTDGTGTDLFDHSLVHENSILLTKVNILREAYKAQSIDNKDESLKGWADSNGMWPEKIKKVMFKFYQISKNANKSEKLMREKLKVFDTNALGSQVIDYLQSLELFNVACFEYNYHDEAKKRGYNTHIMVGHRPYFCIMDKMDAKLLRLRERRLDMVFCLGSANVITTKKRFEMAIWSDTTLIARPPQFGG